MKLYEFTYTDNQNLSETDLLQRVGDFLAKEAELQGWASGYNFHQCQKVQQTNSGEKTYDFEVIGKFLDSNSIDFDQETQEVVSGNSSVAASPEAPL